MLLLLQLQFELILSRLKFPRLQRQQLLLRQLFVVLQQLHKLLLLVLITLQQLLIHQQFFETLLVHLEAIVLQ